MMKKHETLEQEPEAFGRNRHPASGAAPGNKSAESFALHLAAMFRAELGEEDEALDPVLNWELPASEKDYQRAVKSQEDSASLLRDVEAFLDEKLADAPKTAEKPGQKKKQKPEKTPHRAARALAAEPPRKDSSRRDGSQPSAPEARQTTPKKHKQKDRQRPAPKPAPAPKPETAAQPAAPAEAPKPEPAPERERLVFFEPKQKKHRTLPPEPEAPALAAKPAPAAEPAPTAEPAPAGERREKPERSTPRPLQLEHVPGVPLEYREFSIEVEQAAESSEAAKELLPRFDSTPFTAPTEDPTLEELFGPLGIRTAPPDPDSTAVLTPRIVSGEGPTVEQPEPEEELSELEDPAPAAEQTGPGGTEAPSPVEPSREKEDEETPPTPDDRMTHAILDLEAVPVGAPASRPADDSAAGTKPARRKKKHSWFRDLFTPFTGAPIPAVQETGEAPQEADPEAAEPVPVLQTAEQGREAEAERREAETAPAPAPDLSDPAASERLGFPESFDELPALRDFPETEGFSLSIEEHRASEPEEPWSDERLFAAVDALLSLSFGEDDAQAEQPKTSDEQTQIDIPGLQAEPPELTLTEEPSAPRQTEEETEAEPSDGAQPSSVAAAEDAFPAPELTLTEEQTTPELSLTEEQVPPELTLTEEQTTPELSLTEEQVPPELTLTEEQTPPELTLTEEQVPPELTLTEEQTTPELSLTEEQVPPELTLTEEQAALELPQTEEQASPELPLTAEQTAAEHWDPLALFSEAEEDLPPPPLSRDTTGSLPTLEELFGPAPDPPPRRPAGQSPARPVRRRRQRTGLRKWLAGAEKNRENRRRRLEQPAAAPQAEQPAADVVPEQPPQTPEAAVGAPIERPAFEEQPPQTPEAAVGALIERPAFEEQPPQMPETAEPAPPSDDWDPLMLFGAPAEDSALPSWDELLRENREPKEPLAAPVVPERTKQQKRSKQPEPPRQEQAKPPKRPEASRQPEQPKQPEPPEPVPSASVRRESARAGNRQRRTEPSPQAPVEEMPEEETAVLHPEEAYQLYAKPLDEIGSRLILTGLFTILSLFFTLYMSQGWTFLPELFSGGTTVYVLLGLLCAMVLVNRKLYFRQWRGEKGLRPALLLGLATLFAALDCFTAAKTLRPPFPVVIGGLLMVFLWGGYDRSLALLTTVKVLRAETLSAGVSEVQDITKGSRGLIRTQPDVDRFMAKLETRDLTERALRIYTPAAAIGGLVLTLLISLGLKQDLFWTGSLVFLGSVPVVGLLAFPRLFCLLSSRLSGAQAALCGYHGAEVFGGEHSILIGDDDIFPPGALTLNGFKVYSGNPDRVIAYAAAAFRSSESALDPVFEDLLVTHNGRHYPVDDFRFYDSGGIGASIQQDVVLLGSLDFMRRMGVHMDRGAKVKQAVYMSLNGELAAVFAVRYTPPENLRRGLAAIAGNRHFKGILVTRTFLGTPGFLKARFGIPTGAFHYPSTKERLRLSEAEMKRSGAQGAILAKDSFSGFAQAAAGGRMLRTATLGAALLALLGGLGGLILMSVLAALASYETATAVNLLFYEAAWLVPTLLLTAWARHF